MLVWITPWLWFYIWYSAVDILHNSVSLFGVSCMAQDIWWRVVVVLWGGGGIGRCFMLVACFCFVALCIFLWSFYILCHGCDCFSDCCSFPFMTPVITPQLSCHSWHPVCQRWWYFMEHSRIKRIPILLNLWDLKLHLLLGFRWPDKY